MSYLRGADRNQVQLLPPCLDDYVPPEAPVRFIDAYVEGLDLSALGFTHAIAADTGRPPYHPADMVKLYVYGYFHRIRSSRRLEAEAGRNTELMWLLRGLCPDFKTIADFRKENLAAFKGLFKQFNLLCRKMGLFGAELVAIDGSKFKAVNNPHRHYTAEQLGELIGAVESRIDDYLKQLEGQDKEAEGAGERAGQRELEQKIELLRESRGRYDELLGKLGSTGQTECSLSDADARKMKGAHGEHLVGYNVQVAVDAKHHLIVAEEVMQAANDYGQLAGMAVAAKEELQVQSLAVVADKGYHQADQLESCEKAGVETFVPERATTSGRSREGREVFPKERFEYDAVADAYRCPAGELLQRGRQKDNRGNPRILYSNAAACRNCPLRSQCTAGAYREVARRPNEAVVERTAERVAGRPELVVRRKEIVEHVFGTLRNGGHDRFLMRGLGKVRVEFSLSALVYNLRRVLNVVGIVGLMSAVQVTGQNGTALPV